MNRAQRRASRLAPDDPRHGTTNGYGNLGCRCDECRAANAASHLAYMQRPEARAVHNARRRTRSTGSPAPIPYDPERIVAGAEPRTLPEWQYAADLAELALTLDAARQFGLVTGGPTVNVDRAAQLLEEAEARKIAPAPPDGLLVAFIDALQKEAGAQ